MSGLARGTPSLNETERLSEDEKLEFRLGEADFMIPWAGLGLSELRMLGVWIDGGGISFALVERSEALDGFGVSELLPGIIGVDFFPLLELFKPRSMFSVRAES